MENTHTPAELRYNIAERLDRSPRQYALQIRRRIIQKQGIGTTTWHEWLRLTKSSSRDIPASALRELSILLNVPMENFFNDKIG